MGHRALRRDTVTELRIRVLVGVFVVAGILSWAGARLWNSFGTLPSVPVAAPIVLALIAVVLAATALSIRARLKAQRERRPEAKGVDPLMAARAVVFGHASALVAALVAGMYGGTGVFLLEYLDIPARRDQAIYAGASVVAAIGVIAAAVFLERVCKLPEDDENDGGPGAAPAA